MHLDYLRIYSGQVTLKCGVCDGRRVGPIANGRCRESRVVNIRRVAALLRELAEALEQEQQAKPRRRTRVEPTHPANPEAVAKVRRALRRQGVAA